MERDNQFDLTTSMDYLDFTELAAIGAVAIAAANTWFLFDDEELNEDDQNFVDPDVGVPDQLATLLKTPSLFKVLTNFTVDEFEELCGAVCPLIAGNVRTTGAPRSVFGRRPKLSSQQRFCIWCFI
jgi:hypothetical protein